MSKCGKKADLWEVWKEKKVMRDEGEMGEERVSKEMRRGGWENDRLN